MKFQLLSIFLIFNIICSCRKDEIAPRGIWINSGNDTLTKRTPSNLKSFKPKLDINDTVASRSHTIKFAVARFKTTKTPALSTITGSLFQDLPLDLLKVFTRGNKPLSEIGFDSSNNTQVSGWKIDGISHLNLNGIITDINNKIDTSTAKALSIIITFYPDGYYTFINNRNQSLNEMGWYQLCIKDGLPVGIIYSALHVGANFKLNPTKDSPMQSFGIWGINTNAFFPLIQINRDQVVLLTMTPIDY